MANTKLTASLPVMRKGDKSESVYAMQVLLAGYGYLQGRYVTGEFCGKTEIAVKDYQRGNELSADGICGKITWAALLGV